MPDPITMTGAYAYDFDPFTEARILCVDAPGKWPVRSMDINGCVSWHTGAGIEAFGTTPRNLIPLQVRQQPVEAWAVVDRAGNIMGTWMVYNNAEIVADRHPGARVAHLIEAPEGKP